MSKPQSQTRQVRRVRAETPTHRFKIGQKVRLKGGFGRSALPASVYQVTGTLPPSGGMPQYSVRSDSERHERVTTEDSLEPVGQPPKGGARSVIL